MRWNMDINKIHKVINDFEDGQDILEKFYSMYKKLITEITTVNEGKFIDKIKEKVSGEFDNFDDLLNDMEKIHTDLNKYLNKIDDTNPWTGHGKYKVDYDEVKNAHNDMKYILENLPQNALGNSYDIESFKDNYRNKISEFNTVDSTIDIEKEYKDEPDKQSYIRNREDEISDDISDYKHNSDILHDVNHEIRILKKELEDYL